MRSQARARSYLGDVSRGELTVLDVGRAAGADALGFGRRVHADEDYVRVVDHGIHFGGEEKVLSTHTLHNLCMPNSIFTIPILKHFFGRDTAQNKGSAEINHRVKVSRKHSDDFWAVLTSSSPGS